LRDEKADVKRLFQARLAQVVQLRPGPGLLALSGELAGGDQYEATATGERLKGVGSSLNFAVAHGFTGDFDELLEVEQHNGDRPAVQRFDPTLNRFDDGSNST
jgi:hypothetical protein